MDIVRQTEKSVFIMLENGDIVRRKLHGNKFFLDGQEYFLDAQDEETQTPEEPEEIEMQQDVVNELLTLRKQVFRMIGKLSFEQEQASDLLILQKQINKIIAKTHEKLIRAPTPVLIIGEQRR